MKDEGHEFAFVATGEFGKPKSVDRKLIRSQCMRGKNRRGSEEESNTRWLEATDSKSRSAPVLLLSFQLPPIHKHTKQHKLPKYPTRSKHGDRAVRHPKHPTAWSNTAPYPLSSIPLPNLVMDVDPESLNILSSIIPGILRAFSLADFGLIGDLQSSQWRDWLFTDVAYTHASVAISLVVRDFLVKRETSKITSLHLRKAIHQLNNNLSDENVSVSDVTVAVVIILGLVSGISNDSAAISAHASGLREIVRRRGGLDSFLHNPQLQVGMTRIDLCLSLISGQRPIFTTGPSSLAHYPSTSPLPRGYDSHYSTSNSEFSIESLVDPKVAAIFQGLQRLTRRINEAASSRQMIRSSSLHVGILTVQYQLLGLEGKLHDVLSECIRVTLLAFLTTTFRILGSRIKYKHITHRLGELCQAIEVSTEQLRELMFWVLMVGTVALFESNETWLKDKWKADVLPLARGLQWTDAERVLKKFVWIDVINEKSGREVFDEIMAQSVDGR